MYRSSALLNTLVKPLAEAKLKTLSYKLGDVEGQALVDTLPDTLT